MISPTFSFSHLPFNNIVLSDNYLLKYFYLDGKGWLQHSGFGESWAGFPDKEAPGTFYRCWLRSRTLVALIALVLTCNCCVNHGQEHQQHGESVFLMGRKQRNNDYCSAGMAPWQLNSQKCPGLRAGSRVWVWPWLWAVQVGNFGQKQGGTWLCWQGPTVSADRCFTTNPELSLPQPWTRLTVREVFSIKFICSDRSPSSFERERRTRSLRNPPESLSKPI